MNFAVNHISSMPKVLFVMHFPPYQPSSGPILILLVSLETLGLHSGQFHGHEDISKCSKISIRNVDGLTTNMAGELQNIMLSHP